MKRAATIIVAIINVCIFTALAVGLTLWARAVWRVVGWVMA